MHLSILNGYDNHDTLMGRVFSASQSAEKTPGVASTIRNATISGQIETSNFDVCAKRGDGYFRNYTRSGYCVGLLFIC